MKKFTLLSLLLSLSLLVSAQHTQAQAQIQVGPRVGYDLNQFEALFIGADVRISTLALPVQINPTFDYYFTDGDASPTQLTVNALYQFSGNDPFLTRYAFTGGGYAGGGFSFFRGDDIDSSMGLNLVGGGVFSVDDLKIFGQAEFVIGGDYNPIRITSGLLFSF